MTLPSHAPCEAFDVVDDALVVGGLSVERLAALAGQTPFYAYSRDAIRRRIGSLRSALPAGIELHYAMKANPMPAVVDLIAPLVDGLDVASGRELAVAAASGMDPREISFAGPGKSVSELERAVALGILLNVESPLELERLAAIAQRTGLRPRVAIRVNPDFELKSSGMKMGGGPKQFGIDAEAVPGVLGAMAAMPVEFVGFHIFGGSQNLRPEAIVEAQQQALALAVRLAPHAPGPVRVLNIGGGFGIPYFPGEQRLDLAPIMANLERVVADAAAALPGVRIVLELGRYLVGEAGVYVCRIVDRKVSRGHVFLVTDGGLHHHLAASGNFGQVIRKNYPVVIANRVRGTERETASVVGPLCTPLDLLADRMELAKAGPGDLVAVLQSGAYGLTASPLGFLSHPHPAELLV